VALLLRPGSANDIGLVPNGLAELARCSRRLIADNGYDANVSCKELREGSITHDIASAGSWKFCSVD